VVAEDGTLLGRADELESVLAALERSRLVAITGPGGVGKTRLALSAANRVGDDPSRVWWVELAAVDAGGVADAIADVVGGGGPGVEVMDAVVAVLASAPAVVVLDNCEHLVGPAGDVVQVFLNACSQLRILVTSRIPLGLSVEHVVPLSPLAVPDAVALFVERARAVNPRFELTDQNAADVAEICERLDGLPLAVELAAARVQSIPPAEIVRHLDERLRLLRRSVRDRSGRHRSLEEALRWSYELLSDEERHVFNRLSVFAGGFTATAAAAVSGVGDTLYLLDLLDGLAERSMVVAAGTDTEARYRVLETMAEFGHKELDGEGAADAVLDAHRRHYLGVVEEAAVALQGPDEARWVERLHGDLADIRSVFGRAASADDVDTALRIVVSLFDYAFYRMRGDVGQWAAAAIALPGADSHPLYGRAAAVAGYLAWERGVADDAERFTAIALEHDGGFVAFDSQATIDLFAGRVDESIAHFEAAVEVARRDGNQYREAIALAQVAFAMVFAGRDDAYDVAALAEPIARSTGSPTARTFAAWGMGVSLYHAPRRALELLETAMEWSRDVDNRMAFGAAATPASELRTKLGSRTVSSDLEAALEQAEYWMAMGNAPNVWLTMRRVARDFSGLGDHEAAAMAFAAEADAASKLPMRTREGDRHQAAVDRTRDALGDAEYDRQAARGAAMTPEDLVAELRRRAREQTGDREDRRPAS
jgi:predicted ATPase